MSEFVATNRLEAAVLVMLQCFREGERKEKKRKARVVQGEEIKPGCKAVLFSVSRAAVVWFLRGRTWEPGCVCPVSDFHIIRVGGSINSKPRVLALFDCIDMLRRGEKVEDARILREGKGDEASKRGQPLPRRANKKGEGANRQGHAPPGTSTG